MLLSKGSDVSLAFSQLKSCRVEWLQEEEMTKILGTSTVPLEIQDKELTFFLHVVASLIAVCKM